MLTSILVLQNGNYIYADVFKGRFNTGKLTWINDSGSTESLAKSAVNVWNNISSKVTITKYAGSKPKNAKIRMSCNKFKHTTSGVLGLTILLGKSRKEVTTNSTWYYAYCIQYRSSYLDTLTKRRATAVHEVGHALGLAHPSNKSKSSIMHQGVKTSSALKAYDKQELIRKWGK